MLGIHIEVTGVGVRLGHLTSMIASRWRRVERSWSGTSMLERTSGIKKYIGHAADWFSLLCCGLSMRIVCILRAV